MQKILWICQNGGMRWRQRRVYLDTAAGMAGNPSSPHAEGRAARERLERARREVAQLVEAQADDVIFTSGATEGNALAILGVTRAAREAGRAAHVLYQPGAHASITENVKRAAREGAVVEALPLRDGRVDTDALAAMLRPETVLVAMEAVCGETGVVWNTREVAQILKKELRAPRSNLENPDLRFDLGARALLLVDASQAPLTEKITRDHFGADLLVFDGAKVAPMHGVGALVAHRTIPLVSLYDGGGQERGVRPGTASPELAARFAAALRAAANGREPVRAGS